MKYNAFTIFLTWYEMHVVKKISEKKRHSLYLFSLHLLYIKKHILYTLNVQMTIFKDTVKLLLTNAIISVVIIIIIYYIMKALNIFGPTKRQYDDLVNSFNTLADRYNHAVRRTYMVFIKVGSNVDGLPIHVKLVTSNMEQAVEIEPIFEGLYSGSGDRIFTNQHVLTCYRSEKNNERPICARMEKLTSELDNISMCYPIGCQNGPTCTLKVPYIDNENNVSWGQTRALGISIYFDSVGNLQITQLKCAPYDDGKNKSIKNQQNANRGEFVESWNIDGKIWNMTNNEEQTTKSDKLSVIRETYLLPENIEENSYYRLWVNATGAVDFSKCSLPEYVVPVYDKPLSMINKDVKPIEAAEQWKTF